MLRPGHGNAFPIGGRSMAAHICRYGSDARLVNHTRVPRSSRWRDCNGLGMGVCDTHLYSVHWVGGHDSVYNVIGQTYGRLRPDNSVIKILLFRHCLDVLSITFIIATGVGRPVVATPEPWDAVPIHHTHKEGESKAKAEEHDGDCYTKADIKLG